MNKKTIFGFIAVAIFVGVFEWIVHGNMLSNMYMATADAWRPYAEMDKYCQWGFLAMLIFSFMFVRIFECNYENKGLGEGYRYGLLVGLLMSGPVIGSYTYLPIPMIIVFAWVLTIIIKCIVSGLLVAKVFASVD